MDKEKTLMLGILFAVYATVMSIDAHRIVHRHEYQLIRPTMESRHWVNKMWEPYPAFSTMEVCERWRERFVADWVAYDDVPFHLSNVVSSRCGPWEPNAVIGEDS